MKKLFLDEMFCGHRDHFRLMGYDPVIVTDVGLNGCSDAEVVQYVKDNDLFFVTQDVKAYDLAQAAGVDAFLVSMSFVARSIANEITVGGKQS